MVHGWWDHMGFWDRKLTQIWKDEIVVRVRWRGWCIDQWLKRRDPCPPAATRHMFTWIAFSFLFFFNGKNKIIGYAFFVFLFYFGSFKKPCWWHVCVNGYFYLFLFLGVHTWVFEYTYEIMGVFGLSLFLLKLKTEIENIVAK